MPHTAPETFRTDVVARPGRLAFWNDVATRTFGDISVAALDRNFTGRLKRVRLGNLTLASVCSSPACINGATATLRGSDGWFFLLNERGTSRLRQLKREVCLRPGELTVVRSDERYQIEFTEPNKTLVLHLPGIDRLGALESHIACRHGADELPLFTGLMRQLERAEGRSTGDLARLGTLACEIAELCWPTQPPARRRQPMRAWEQLIHAQIAQHLGDPRLNAAFIAQRLGISARFVHTVFARNDQTVGSFILERRLAAAAIQLRHNVAASVTDVALEAGFADLSHFCRVFKRRFGLSARKFRDS